jgi:hypothetical protein
LQHQKIKSKFQCYQQSNASCFFWFIPSVNRFISMQNIFIFEWLQHVRFVTIAQGGRAIKQHSKETMVVPAPCWIRWRPEAPFMRNALCIPIQRERREWKDRLSFSLPLLQMKSRVRLVVVLCFQSPIPFLTPEVNSISAPRGTGAEFLMR